MNATSPPPSPPTSRMRAGMLLSILLVASLALWGCASEPAPPLVGQILSAPAPKTTEFSVGYPPEAEDWRYVSLAFSSEGVDLSADARASLDQVARLLHADPDIIAEIWGRSGALGSRAQSLALSAMRADWVARYLRAQGVRAEQVNVFYAGRETFFVPVNPNPSAAGLASNVRFEAEEIQEFDSVEVRYQSP